MALTDCVVDHALIQASFRRPFSEGWNGVPGVRVDGSWLTIDPNQYFFRYEQPAWLLCDWNAVRDHLVSASETPAKTIEQQTLEFVRENSFRTTDPAAVLTTAEEVYAFIFRPARLADADLVSMGVAPSHPA